ncbi:hypothetical protein TB1_000807 [Malus domestica]
MKDVQGMPSTAGGLALRLCQLCFTAISLSIVATTSDFPTVNAFCYLSLRNCKAVCFFSIGDGVKHLGPHDHGNQALVEEEPVLSIPQHKKKPKSWIYILSTCLLKEKLKGDKNNIFVSIKAMFITRNQAIGLLLIFLGISDLRNDCVSGAGCLNEKGENLGKPRVFNSKPHHKWVGPSGHRLVMVNMNGSGDFQSVQSTVNVVPVNNTVNVVILIKFGCSIEKVGVPTTKLYTYVLRCRRQSEEVGVPFPGIQSLFKSSKRI